MIKNIALIGNANCGKSSLYNLLTGTYQKVGNWSGVTVDKKTGNLRKNKKIFVTDLPGIYSLDTVTEDEKCVSNFIKKGNIDLIINVLDGTNLKRSFSLTSELLKLNIPMIIAINFADKLKKENIKIDIDKLSKITNTKVFLISAYKNIGVKDLVDYILESDIKDVKISTNSITFKSLFSCVEIGKNNNFSFIKIDRILLNKIWGFPIFILIMFTVYFISLKGGNYFSYLVEKIFDFLSHQLANLLKKINTSHWIITLLSNGIIRGIGGVISFLPQILILFFLLSILEGVGYMSRVSVLFDRLLKNIGLSGKSVIPLVLACGCSVTGLMSTRTIEDKKERDLTIFLVPYMPCGAKMAVFGWLSKIFFNGSALIALSMYLLSILTIIIIGKICVLLKYFKSKDSCYFIELPPYRLPSIKNLFYTVMEKIKDFLYKAGTVVLIVSIAVWLLKYFGVGGYNYGNIYESFIYYIGKTLNVIFIPLGFKKPEVVSSLIFGIFAREGVIESITVLSDNPLSLFDNAYQVISYMSFILLSPPCTSAILQAKRELCSTKKFILFILLQFVVAYIVSLIINFVGIMFSSIDCLLLFMFVGIIYVCWYNNCRNNCYYF